MAQIFEKQSVTDELVQQMVATLAIAADSVTGWRDLLTCFTKGMNRMATGRNEM